MAAVPNVVNLAAVEAAGWLATVVAMRDSGSVNMLGRSVPIMGYLLSRGDILLAVRGSDVGGALSLYAMSLTQIRAHLLQLHFAIGDMVLEAVFADQDCKEPAGGRNTSDGHHREAAGRSQLWDDERSIPECAKAVARNRKFDSNQPLLSWCSL